MTVKTLQDLMQKTYLTSGNESYLENLYEDYLVNPQEVSPEWRAYFNQLKDSLPRNGNDISHAAIRESFVALARQSARVTSVSGVETVHDQNQERVTESIAAYRRLGHLQANIDPLGLYKGVDSPELSSGYYGFTGNESKVYSLGSFAGLNANTATIKELFTSLKRVYCHTIGFEYMHINRAEEVEWIRERIEKSWSHFNPGKEEKLRLLNRLVMADGLEKYLGFKYVGQKRFSLEGGDSLIPMLDAIVNRSAALGIKETIIGMAHRGRLNVLTNIVGRDPKAIFAAFEGTGISGTHSGDVKYHLGYASNVKTSFGLMHIALAFNPSHLEIVSPVVQGSVRARQRRRRDSDQNQVLPIQIHGDAAFSGQGVVMETFNMSQLRWFKVGGSIHIVINNQVGFTTNPLDARSTTYCTDVAKMVDAPILHVNANDPEAALFAALFAIDYHTTFKKDVVIDLVCYRRHGHNEADEPSATQPVMYKIIKAMPAPYLLYAQKLKEEGLLKEGEEKKMADAYRKALDDGQRVVEVSNDASVYEYNVNWVPFTNTSWTDEATTAVALSHLQEIGKKMEVLPEGFVVQPQVKKILEAQKKMTRGEIPLNWGYAENMAYATLLDQGYPIRLCGQDVGRGTFAHRHALLYDQNTNEVYVPLSHISNDQAQINIVDSLLSEEAVLAFEYGYATAEPNFLVTWEAQFGDFANGAQVVIDQFLSSGEQKWGRLCGLVMLLPHGYEAMGPEHSSARIERYLQLCAQDNIQVCIPSTPAQIFHLLRRQMIRPYRKPLIVMTPKSFLRHPLATSSLTELTEGEFQLMLPEVDNLDNGKCRRLVLCSGKIFYELLEYRREKKIDDIAIVRIEQLYPFPGQLCQKILAEYANVKDIVWCQEEPQNQGAYPTLSILVRQTLSEGQSLRYVGRVASASPAVGYHSIHEKEQAAILETAFT